MHESTGTEMAKCVTGIEKEVFEECVARERQWVSFQANLTTEDALALKAFSIAETLNSKQFKKERKRKWQ